MDTQGRTQPFLVPGVLLFSLVLIQAPLLLGAQPPVLAYPVVLLPFVVAICSLLMQRGRWFAHWSALLAVGYVALVAVAAMRADYFDVLSQNAAIRQVAQFMLVATLGLLAFVREPREAQRALHLRALCWAPAVFVAVNVALSLAGVVPSGRYDAATEAPATLLGLLGVNANRVLFPLSSGVLGIAPTATVALAICVMLALRNEQRTLAVIGALLSLYVILAIDSRGGLLFAGLALLLMVFVPRARQQGLAWVAILLPVMPIVLILMLTGLAETEAGVRLERGETEGLNTGTGRTVVWSEVYKTLARPSIDHVFGYGQLGQVKSGASVDYAYLFRDYEGDPLTNSAHNLVLQSLLDLGWFGTVCLVLLAAVVITRLSRLTHDPLHAALLAGALSLLLLGIVQSDPTPAHPESFAFWLLVIFAATRAQYHDSRTGSNATVDAANTGTIVAGRDARPVM